MFVVNFLVENKTFSTENRASFVTNNLVLSRSFTRREIGQLVPLVNGKIN